VLTGVKCDDLIIGDGCDEEEEGFFYPSLRSAPPVRVITDEGGRYSLTRDATSFSRSSPASTLVVNDCELLPSIGASLDNFARINFRQIPNVARADVQLSVGTDNGSVGAHVDRFAVWLCQVGGGGGKRWELEYELDDKDNVKWTIDSSEEVTRRVDGEDGLRTIANWGQGERKGIASVEVLPGDVLYLPPLVPHHGVSLASNSAAGGTELSGFSCTLSVGTRFPSGEELLASLSDYTSEVAASTSNVALPFVRPDMNPGEINPALFDTVRNSMYSSFAAIMANDERLADFIGRSLTDTRGFFGEEENLDDALAVQLQPGLMILFNNEAVFVDGERFDYEEDEREIVEKLGRAEEVTWRADSELLNEFAELGFLKNVEQ